MRAKTLVFASVFLIALYLVSGHVRESFQRAEAALVCYWADPGPPLPVPIPRDPKSIPIRGGPRASALKPQRKNNTLKRRRTFLQSVKTRSQSRPQFVTQSPVLPSSTAVPYETPSAVPTPVPTLGVLSIPPEITVTPIPMLV
jgi:hypothetical protein